MLVVAAHELVTGGDEKLHVVNFGARLVEPFTEIVQFEKNKIHRSRRGDANYLSLFHFRRPTGVVRHMGLSGLSSFYMSFLCDWRQTDQRVLYSASTKPLAH